jgi:hypothetical protein
MKEDNMGEKRQGGVSVPRVGESSVKGVLLPEHSGLCGRVSVLCEIFRSLTFLDIMYHYITTNALMIWVSRCVWPSVGLVGWLFDRDTLSERPIAASVGRGSRTSGNTAVSVSGKSVEPSGLRSITTGHAVRNVVVLLLFMIRFFAMCKNRVGVSQLLRLRGETRGAMR